MEFTQYGLKDNPAVLFIANREKPAQVKKVIDALSNQYYIHLARAASTDFDNGVDHNQEKNALYNSPIQHFYAICCFSSGFQPMMSLLSHGLNADYLVVEGAMADPGQEILVAAREWA